jgi:3-oxocholest-4-en-26-oyl-CoA dehydrogenase alpha subunit
MHIDLTDEQRRLKRQLRAYFADLMTVELHDELHATEGGGPLYHAAMHQMAADGWLGLGWPVEVGGKGRPPIEEFLFFNEVQRAGFPIPLLTLNTVAPALIHFGSDAQKSFYLSRILEGKCHFSIGYTEPESGTDLASLRTSAVRDGDHYVVNGQKIWNSLADHADYLWLACRTDPEAAPHKGISILIVPMDAPGVQRTPMAALGDNNVHAVYLEDVRVPVENLVGREHAGWKLITTQLNHERVALMSVGPLERLLGETTEFAASTACGEGRLIDLPWVCTCLARVRAGVDALRLLNWKQAWAMGRGSVAPADASVLKVFGSELYVSAYRDLLQVLGEAGTLQRGSAGAALQGQVERYYRATLVLTFGGGTNEVQRDIIAMTALRMPRGRR